MPIPKAISKKTLLSLQEGLTKHIKKPDIDNFLKLYLDCMDKTCFDGDQKVSLGSCIKLYHMQPKTIILIEEMQPVLSQQEVDPSVYDCLAD